jgi:parallel beta-helix repeat protein
VVLALLGASCHHAASPAVPSISIPGGSTQGCGTSVPAGSDVAEAVAAAPEGAVICLAPGDYRVDHIIRPLTGQTLRGTGPSAPTLTCTSVPYCIDGFEGGTGVTVSNLVLRGAQVGDIRTTDGWTVSQMEATDAGESGFKLQGANVTARDVYALSDGRFGIVAKGATDVTIDRAFVAVSPTDPSFGDGYSAGMKLNFVDGATVTSSTLVDANGGAALWLDNNSLHFTLSSNTIERADHDAIRIEISCFGTIDGNTVSGAGNAGIDLFNAHDVQVTNNTVSGVGSWAIRMLGNGRSQGSGGDACLDQGQYATVRNIASGNRVMLSSGNSVGVQQDGGMLADLTWTGNRYTASDCSASAWVWWDGTSSGELSFPGWQGMGQDAGGSCTTQSAT